MIDGEELDLVEVVGLPQFGRHAELILAILRLELVTVDLEVFPLAPRSDDVLGKLQTNRCVPQQIRDKLESLAIPSEQIRTRSSQLLFLADDFVGSWSQEVHRDAIRPQDSHHTGCLAMTKAKVRDRSRDDLSLVARTRFDFDRTTDAHMIGPFADILFTGLPLLGQQLDGEPVVGIATVVRVPLAAFGRRDDDILITIAIHITDRQSHGRLQPTRRFLFTDFQRTIEHPTVEGDTRFASHREISRAVVVEIEYHDLSQRRVRHTSGLLHRDHSRRRRLCENDVQAVWSRADHIPRTVAVEFLNQQAPRLFQRREVIAEIAPTKTAVPQTFEQAETIGSRDEDVQIRVLVPVANHGGGRTEVGGRQLGSRGDFLETPVASVRPEPDAIGCECEEVQIAIQIEIDRHQVKDIAQRTEGFSNGLLDELARAFR